MPNNSPCFFTICTPSHLHIASCSARSLQNSCSNENIDCKIVIYLLGCQSNISDWSFLPGHIEHIEDVLGFQLVSELAATYTPQELCWSLKPHLFLAALERNNIAVYFDADGWFTSSILDVLSELGSASVMLTPHYLNPFLRENRSGLKSLTLLKAGLYNAGFIAVRKSEESIRFLVWWREVLKKHCYNMPQKGMCGDQRWLDLAPVLFPNTHISRHPGINVAYWNIHERLIRKDGNKYFANKRNLIYFHFSGFNAKHPNQLSRHLPKFTASGALAELINEYQEALNSEANFIDQAQLEFSYNRIRYKAKRLYRRWRV